MTRRLRIGFIACGGAPGHFQADPGFIYRCQNPGLYLRQHGHWIIQQHLDQPLEERLDIAVFHRPRASWALRAMLTRLRKNGTAVLADFDDLVFDAAFARHSPGVVNGLNSLLLTRLKFHAHAQALGWFNRVSVATEELATRLRARHPALRVAVLHNAVHIGWHGMPLAPPRPGERKVLAYFPGTRSHDRDFAAVAPQLARFLDARPEVELHVTGPLRFDLPNSRVVHRRKTPFSEFVHGFQGLWANLAPLEDTPFNRAKSALKVLEAGYWGVPTVCPEHPDMNRFLGAGAVTARGGDWLAALESLLDESRYAELTHDLRARVLQRADVAEQAAGLLALAAGES